MTDRLKEYEEMRALLKERFDYQAKYNDSQYTQAASAAARAIVSLDEAIERQERKKPEMPARTIGGDMPLDKLQ